MFFIIALLILWTMHGYVAYRIIPTIGLSSFQSIFAYILTFLLSLLPIIPILLRMSGNEAKIIDKLSLVGYTSLGFFTLSFMTFLAKDIFVQLLSFSSGLFNDHQIIDDKKRDFIKKSLSIGLLGITGSATVYGFSSARIGPRIFKQDIYLESLPIEFEDFKIAQISDLHVGPTIKRPYVENVLDQISQINPNLIAVTGDLVDGSVKYLRSDLEPLRDMIAHYGTFFVTGNHEYYSGVDQWLDETEKIGMINLVNENKIISINEQKIAIAGITDYKAHQIKTSHKSNPKKALENVPENMTRIMLAHQPKSIYAVHEAGVDLQLSGHTHGGQFWPFTYPTKLANTYLAGHYDHFGTQIYVNRGTGYWGPPLRLGVSAEITLFRLKKKKTILS